MGLEAENDAFVTWMCRHRIISHWSFVVTGRAGFVVKGQELNVSSKCKVKSAKFEEKNTFIASGIRRSEEAVFGES